MPVDAELGVVQEGLHLLEERVVLGANGLATGQRLDVRSGGIRGVLHVGGRRRGRVLGGGVSTVIRARGVRSTRSVGLCGGPAAV